MAIARFSFSSLSHFVKGNFPVPKEGEDLDKFPKWCLFVNIHLGQSFDDYQIERNAEIIGKLDETLFNQKMIPYKVLEENGLDLEPNNPIWD